MTLTMSTLIFWKKYHHHHHTYAQMFFFSLAKGTGSLTFVSFIALEVISTTSNTMLRFFSLIIDAKYFTFYTSKQYNILKMES